MAPHSQMMPTFLKQKDSQKAHNDSLGNTLQHWFIESMKPHESIATCSRLLQAVVSPGCFTVHFAIGTSLKLFSMDPPPYLAKTQRQVQRLPATTGDERNVQLLVASQCLTRGDKRTQAICKPATNLLHYSMFKLISLHFELNETSRPSQICGAKAWHQTNWGHCPKAAAVLATRKAYVYNEDSE